MRTSHRASGRQSRLATIAIAFALAACGEASAPDAPDPDLGPTPSRPNVLLVSLDTLRADHLSTYGYGRPTAPFLDSLAADGILVRHAFVNTLTTKSSHATIFSSRSQESHRLEYGVRDGVESAEPLPAGLDVLPERLRTEGYVTLAVTDGLFLSQRFGFTRGFDAFDERGGGVEPGARKLVEMIERESGTGRPIFAFFHTYQPHSPYDPPEGEARRFADPRHPVDARTEALIPFANRAAALGPERLEHLRGLYDGEILHTDAVLRQLFEALEAIGFFRNHLVVITSDHGEEFGEHGGLLHRGLLYDEFIRVPLLLRGTGLPRGEVWDGLASSVDIAPTILAFTGAAVPPEMEGRDLLNDADGDDVVFSQFRRWRYAVRTKDWKLITSSVPQRTELYDLRTDPGEQTNVADRHPATVHRLRQELADWKASRVPLTRPDESLPVAPLDEEERRRLRELGYVIEE